MYLNHLVFTKEIPFYIVVYAVLKDVCAQKVKIIGPTHLLEFCIFYTYLSHTQSALVLRYRECVDLLTEVQS